MPKAQRRLLAVSGSLVLLLVMVGIVFGIQGGRGTSELTASPTKATAAPCEQPSEEPEEILTVDNNEDLAALLASGDPDMPKKFVAKYQGETIEFDGNIAYMDSYGDNDARYDILIYAGDYGVAYGGPSLEFEDVSIVYDLHLTGSNIPDTLGEGQNLRIAVCRSLPDAMQLS